MHRWLFRMAASFTALSIFVLGAGAAMADQTFNVDMADFTFSPRAYNVRVGEKVTFVGKNVGQRPHTITIEGQGVKWTLANGNVAAGQSATGDVTFTAPGTYDFYCPVGNHRQQGMVATFTVSAAAGAQTSTLPRSGEPITMLGGALGALGALSLAGGVILRRRGS